jgi:rhodanese-related sulfurtransferase
MALSGPLQAWIGGGSPVDRAGTQWDDDSRGHCSRAALSPHHRMNDIQTRSAEDRAKLEITLPAAMELCRLGLATLIDIRQSFEIAMKGAISDTVHIPMFEVKRMLGHTLTDDEQDILDDGQPKDIDAKSFFTMINRLHHARDHRLLCICNSGRRSVAAASLLRSLGYSKALSVAGGLQAWKKLQTPAVAADAPAAAP